MIEFLRSVLHNKKNPKILIWGNYGEGNVGDEAILISIISDLHELGIRDIVVPSRNIEKLKELHGEKIVAIKTIPSFKFINVDIIIVGGGGIFNDVSGPFVSLGLLYCIMMRLLFFKKVIFYSIGYSNKTSIILKLLAMISMNIANDVSVRDMTSFQNTKFVINRDVKVTQDPALKLRSPDIKIINDIMIKEKIDENRKLVGISLNPDKVIKYNIEKDIVELINYLNTNYNVDVIFFVFNPEFTNRIISDREMGVNLSKYCRIKILNYYDPITTLGLVGKMDFFIAMRFHSLIFAYKSNVPYIKIIYDEKCESFLESHGNLEDGIYLSEFDFEKFIKRFKVKLDISIRE